MTEKSEKRMRRDGTATAALLRAGGKAATRRVERTRRWHDNEATLVQSLKDTYPDDDIPFLAKALRDGTCFRTTSMNADRRTPDGAFEVEVAKLRGRISAQYDNGRRLYSWAWGQIAMQWNGYGQTSIVIRSSCVARFLRLVVLVESHYSYAAPPVPPPQIYGFVPGHGAYEVEALGPVEGGVIQWDNYGRDVREDAQAFIREIATPQPDGRLVLLEGERGTGKTHVIEHMVHALHGRARCILVPADSVARLADPPFIQALAKEARRSRGSCVPHATILILEDADGYLRDRSRFPDASAAAAISNLLNYADGIAGRAMHLRIVASSNLPPEDVDDSLVRRGRLLARINFKRLSPNVALGIYQRELGDDADPRFLPDSRITLASVYGAVSDCRKALRAKSRPDPDAAADAAGTN